MARFTSLVYGRSGVPAAINTGAEPPTAPSCLYSLTYLKRNINFELCGISGDKRVFVPANGLENTSTLRLMRAMPTAIREKITRLKWNVMKLKTYCD